MGGHSHDHNHDLEEGRRITWIGMGVNAVLIALKLWGGLAGRSRALIADAIHSISDLVSDFIVLIGLHFLGKESSGRKRTRSTPTATARSRPSPRSGSACSLSP